MQQASPNAYLRTQIMTAGPMQLRMLLYDGALRFCRNGREALEAEDYEKSYENLSRTQQIMRELTDSLDHKQAPELCDRLAALYNYLYRRLVEANMRRDPQIVDEVIELIEYERETWRMLIEQQTGENDDNAAAEAEATPAAPPQPPMPGPDGRQSTLSRSA